jgi:hypothetical protein
MGGTLGKPQLKIFDPGASWRRFFCVITTMKPVIAIFLFEAVIREFAVPTGDLVKL